MDISEAQNLVGWMIGIVGVGIISLITGILTVWKSSRMMPKDLTKADLENKLKELDVTDRYELLASKSAEKALQYQQRMSAVEEQAEKNAAEFRLYKKTQDGRYDELESKYLNLEEIVKIQSGKIVAQEEEIALLRLELDSARDYNNILIQQMKDKNIIPASPPSMGSRKNPELKKNNNVKGNKEQHDDKK